MKKAIKNLAAFVTTASLVLACGIFAACGETTPDGEPTNYTVIVKNPYGVAVDDVEVKWGSSGKETTDNDGKATATLNAGDYKITLNNLPEIYTYDTVTATEDNTNIEIKLKLNNKITVGEGQIVYTVKIVYPDGKPVKDVNVGLCTVSGAGGCVIFGEATNARGEAYRAFAPAEYKAQLPYGSPAGYTYDGEDSEFAYYAGEHATAENPFVKIVLKTA